MPAFLGFPELLFCVLWGQALGGQVPPGQIVPQQAPAVRYVLDIEDPAAGVVRVLARFPTEGRRHLQLRDRGPELFGRGEQMAAMTEGARVEVLSEHARRPGVGPLPLQKVEGGWRVPTEGADEVVMERRLRIPDRSRGTQIEHPFACSLGEEAGVLLGLDLFPVSDGEGRAPMLRLELPEGWNSAVAWPSAGGWLRPPGMEELLSDFVAVGRNLRLAERRIGRQEFVVSVPPALERELPACSEILMQVLEAEVAAFGPLRRRRNLLVLLPMQSTHHQRALNHRGASGPSSLVAYVDPRFPEAFAEHPLAVAVHESLHWWNGRAMRLRPGANQPWFSEGATSYLEHLMLLRCGVVELDFFVQSLVDQWQLARAGSEARFSMEEASARFTRDLPATLDVYRRGSLIAFALDLDLREQGSSIEALIQDLIARGSLARPPGLEAVEILRSVERLGGRPVLDRLRARLASLEPFELAPRLAAIGYELRWEPAPLLGVQLRAEASPTVDRVQPSGPAEGHLRSGDVLLAIEGQSFSDPPGFERSLRRQAAGARVRLRIRRDEEELELELELGSRDEPRARALENADRAARDLRAALSGSH